MFVNNVFLYFLSFLWLSLVAVSSANDTRLRLSSYPNQAVVYLDDTIIGKTPLFIPVEPGRYRLHLKIKNRFESQAQIIDLMYGEATTLHIPLYPLEMDALNRRQAIDNLDFLIPGRWQSDFHKNGNLLLASTFSFLGAVAAFWISQQRYQSYQNASRQSQMDQRFNDAEQWQTLAIGLSGIAVATYIVNAVELLSAKGDLDSQDVP